MYGYSVGSCCTVGVTNRCRCTLVHIFSLVQAILLGPVGFERGLFLFIINDCFEDGNFKTLGDFHSMNLPLTVSIWVCLRSAVLLARKKMTKSDNAPITLDRFLRGIKKGSKKFREVID
jgi:hypothetical protein